MSTHTLSHFTHTPALAVRLDKLIGEGDGTFFQWLWWACAWLNDAILLSRGGSAGITNAHLLPTQMQTHSISLLRRLIQYNSVLLPKVAFIFRLVCFVDILCLSLAALLLLLLALLLGGV